MVLCGKVTKPEIGRRGAIMKKETLSCTPTLYGPQQTLLTRNHGILQRTKARS